MNSFELARTTGKLPTTIDDLVPLSFIGNEAVKFYKSKIKLMDKLDITEEQKQQTLKDGQDAGIMLLEIESRIGELLDKLPKTINNENSLVKSITKKGELDKVGYEGNYGKLQAYNARKIKDNPEIVQETIKEAIENEDIPTKTAVLNKIKLKKYMEKHPLKEKTMPDINNIAFDIWNKLTECYTKLLKIYEHKENISERNKTGIKEIINKINNIIGENNELER